MKGSADNSQQAQPQQQDPGMGPLSDSDIMTGYDQFEIYRGDFFPESDDDNAQGADHSGSQNAPVDNSAGINSDNAAPADGGTTGKEEGQQGGEAARFKYKSQTEAERAYANLMSRTTRTEQENARLRKQIEEQRSAEAKKQRDMEAARQRDEFLQQKYEEAAEAVDELDPDDPEYHKKTARIWAGIHREVDQFEPAFDDGGKDDGPPAGAGDEPPRASDYVSGGQDPGADPGGQQGEPEAGQQADAGQPAGDAGDGLSLDEIHQKIDSVIAGQKPGFDRQDPAFTAFCSQAPVKDENGADLSIDDQIAWAVDKTRAHYDAKRREILQANAQPMDRGGGFGGGAGGGGSQGQENQTFGDIVESAVASHTL